MALGDAQAGYDYNALLYQLDLSPAALYGGYFLVGILGLGLIWSLLPIGRHGKKH